MQRLSDEQSKVYIEDAGRLIEGIERGSAGEGEVKPVSQGVDKVGVGGTSIKPKGSSMTLLGCGRRDGSDVNNSMGLVEYYRDVVLRRP